MINTVTDILKYLIGEVNASEKLSDAAKKEFVSFATCVVPDVVLTIRLRSEDVDETREQILSALKKYGVIDYSLVYDMDESYYFRIDLKTVWFENLLGSPEFMRRNDNSGVTPRPGRTSEVPRVHFQKDD